MDSEPRDPGDLDAPVVVPVAPAVRGRSAPTVPRVVVVALVVGLVAFLIGTQFGSGKPSATNGPDASAFGASGSSSPPPTAGAVSSTLPGLGEFSASFDPQPIIVKAAGIRTCVTHDEWTRDQRPLTGDPVFVRIWTTYCPLKAAKRAAFAQAVLDGIAKVVPAAGWTTNTDDAGSTVSTFAYGEPPLVGTLSVALDTAGAGYEIVITLEETASK